MTLEDIINNRKTQRQKIKEIRGKHRINVMFIISSLSMWNHQRLYELMEQDPRFNTNVIFVPFSVYSNDDNNNSLSQIKAYFAQHNTPFLIFDELDFTQKSFEEQFSPDILFYPQWYIGLYPNPIDIKTNKNKLLCFIPYGIGITPTGIGVHEEITNLAWKVYQTTDAHLQASQKLMQCKGDNVVVVGHPRAEEYALSPISDPWKVQEKKKKRVIWAPHFTITEGLSPLCRSNFLQIANIIWNIAQATKDFTQFAFKPHPRLITELYNHPDWGKEKTDTYYQQWANGFNTQLETGEYVELFKTSDALIHDSGSFTLEYLYTHKPVMFLTKDVENIKQTDKMLDIACKALDVHYIGLDEQEIKSFINEVVLKGIDVKKEEREDFFRKYLLRQTSGTTSELIYEDICDDIWGPEIQEAIKFSFVLPIYNVDKYLCKCLESITQQTYSNIEIICVNDGSTDNCEVILQEFASRDSRVRVINQENKGTFVARKKGTETATGDYIIYVDPDDWVETDTCQQILKCLKQNNTDIIQFGFFIEPTTEITVSRLEITDSYFNRRVDDLKKSDNLLEECFLKNTFPFNQCGKAIRTTIAQKAFLELPAVRCNYAEDQCLAFLIFLYSENLHCIPLRLYHYRYGVGISTKSSTTLKDFEQIMLSFNMLEVLNQHVNNYHKNKKLYFDIIHNIKSSITEACTGIAMEKLPDSVHVDEWFTPLYSMGDPNVVVKIISQKLTSLSNRINELLSQNQELHSQNQELLSQNKILLSQQLITAASAKKNKKRYQTLVWILTIYTIVQWIYNYLML